MIGQELLRSLREQVGIAPLLISIFSLPIVSYISYHLTLGVPIELASPQGLARYSFFLFGSIVATLAASRIIDFLLAGLFIICVEAFVFIRTAIKIARRKPSDMAIARYELKVIESTDNFSRSRISARTHMFASLMLTVLFYWLAFLDGSALIWNIGLLLLVFVLASSGFTRRREMQKDLFAKRELLSLVRKNRKEVDALDSVVSKLREQVTDKDEDLQKKLEDAVSQSDKARKLFERVQKRESSLRLFSIGFRRSLISIYSGIRPDMNSAMANPVGAAAVAFAIVVFIGMARANGILNSHPWLVGYLDRVGCARILAITDAGFYLQSSEFPYTRVFVLSEQFKFAESRARHVQSGLYPAAMK